ncbi:family 78 glycoside hydrolase catalytic domain [Cohnella zeiphila]|uniref:Family 78 glycoside hydrolase catalytic domain n=1 Tax=Cohnella zeiphila TaxID=2761120 RepID=A0A7X0VYD7_9BACL|nr:family 78 glycoside hydrolase catalytic domain [Cohnella zeiphila]MBB6734377.1 family 78 glycoside hydrolase catalytic domain [Cohnella zeiphila]
MNVGENDATDRKPDKALPPVNEDRRGGMESSEARWIWYPGDYEHWLNAKASVLRQYRGYVCPPVWRLDTAYSNVMFRRSFELEQPEVLTLTVQGDFIAHLDGSMEPVPCERRSPAAILLPVGRHELTVKVVNDAALPAIYAESEHCGTGSGWEVTCFDGRWVPAASWAKLNRASRPPAAFPFEYETVCPASVFEREGKTILDFGRETFGHLSFKALQGTGVLRLHYGESLEEAMAGERAETTDELVVSGDAPCDVQTAVARAFRYVQLAADDGISWREALHEYEFLPMKERGAFRCSDELLNRIWDVSAYTLRINMREFLYDGMKRDRWVWSGDANLGFLINHYSYFEQDVTRRTLIALRGKDPVRIHINTIMDYTFYWFLSLSDYYMYTGDLDFIRSRYTDMLSLAEFCLGRRNSEGMMEGFPEDWVFVDWADMERRGELCFEQLMFCRSLETVAEFAQLLNDSATADRFAGLAEDLREQILHLFWDENQSALIHGRLAGEKIERLLKYPNMFALRFGYLDEQRKESVKRNVLLNRDVPAIKTPFMRFFELEALCEVGERLYVLDEMRRYWGGMLALGATTFWEEYDPSLSPELQYDMYGDKYRKSLCHAWGAAPIYLLGKFLLGVRPEAPGYKRYRIEPFLGDLEWMEGEVPTPDGEVKVRVTRSDIVITTPDAGVGTLRFPCAGAPFCEEGELVPVGSGYYELELTKSAHTYRIAF